jgi:hypothetical protein
MISIQSHPRFKKDCERYNRAIRECGDDNLKKELKSLYNRYIATVTQIDQSLGLLVAERLSNETQNKDLQQNLQAIRAELEKKIA